MDKTNNVKKPPLAVLVACSAVSPFWSFKLLYSTMFSNASKKLVLEFLKVTIFLVALVVLKW